MKNTVLTLTEKGKKEKEKRRALRTLSLLVLPFLFFLPSTTTAQNGHFAIGPEAQQYPTGFLLGVRAEMGILDHSSIDLRLGYNTFDHKDFGVHNEEVGDGFGFTLGYRYYFRPERERWFIGARCDLWWNEVDWKDYTITEIIEGTSNITVVQPTAIGGYVFPMGDHWQITPTVAGGLEWNVKTKGANTGEGPILLWGIQLNYKI